MATQWKDGCEQAGGAPLVRYRNRDIGARELEFLRAAISSKQWSTLVELAEFICERWQWRQANGGLSLHGCFDLLRRLAEWGYIELPRGRRQRRARRSSGKAQRAQSPPRHDRLPVELIPIAEISVTDADADLDTLVVRPITPEERLGWRVYIERYHYLGYKPIVGEHLLYAAFLDTELVAVLGWASPAFRLPARERFVGWDENTKRAQLHLIANNFRFLVFPWVSVKNLASKILACNVRRLSADWQQRWGHPIYLVETFVDSRRYRGTCYRAANWIYLGETAGRAKRGNRYLYGATPKLLFVYELHRHARARLCGQSRP